MTQVFIFDKINVQQGTNCYEFEKDHYPTPLDFLELAVSSCIGLEIKKYMQDRNMSKCPFFDIRVGISKEHLRFICKCDVHTQDDFRGIVNKCYVSSKTTFPKIISFI